VLASSLRRQVGRVPVYRGNAARLHAPHHPHSVDRALHKLGPVLSTPTSQTQGVLHRSSPSSPSPTSTSLRPSTSFPSACSTSRSTVHRPRVCSRRRGVRGSARRPGSQTPSRCERSQSAGSTSGHGAHPAPSAAILRAPPTCRRRARTTHKGLLPFVDNHSPWRPG
ncbi:hypothetical protein B0H14DRAFT_3906540, partial [Mycena olivaceomarginata]